MGVFSNLVAIFFKWRPFLFIFYSLKSAFESSFLLLRCESTTDAKVTALPAHIRGVKTSLKMMTDRILPITHSKLMISEAWDGVVYFCATVCTR